MKYLRATRTMPLTLEATYMNIIKWWVDASFAVHPDMQSHTGAVMTLGCGAVSKGELVRVHKAMPRILWRRYFLETQGYPTKRIHCVLG
jgi:hypothetical protein